MITTIGSSFPLGATVKRRGVNFSVYSRSATGMELLLFDAVDSAVPTEAIQLDPAVNKTYHYWHVFVPGLEPGQIYAYRAHGPYVPEHGHRYDAEKILLDPYGRATVTPENYGRGDACKPGDNAATAMKSVVTNVATYDWENDFRPRTPWSRTVIYEMHPAGFTRNPNSGVSPDKRGAYTGLVEKIPYLVELGVTAVELLPVFQFDVQDAPLGQRNYWGYSPISFFAPHLPYSVSKDPLICLDEFRDMVKAFHRAGIEVILDVVYNHTAEGNHMGPTLSFKGLENSDYYIMAPERQYYADFTGCGNTLNANHPIVRRMIVDSLRYWVHEMHVDGFRFDLASILSRDQGGHPQPNPPVLFDIETDPGLAGVKLIAEAWDPGGLYQVGSFVGDSWKEWNGKFRDDVRAFVRGDEGKLGALASRILASPDIYGHEWREPEQSINFVTCHDGFTLNDLVSYNEKHNEANGENNRDGENHNLSWNCGTEGPTTDPEIEALRIRQIKNFLTLTLFSLGTPMIAMGDEVRRTQFGNNNAFCQDNELSWFDWTLVEKNAELLRFATLLIQRRTQRAPRVNEESTSLEDILQETRVEWHGTELRQQDWSEHSRSLAATLENRDGDSLLHFMVNSYWHPLDFAVPKAATKWLRIVDTSSAPPEDINMGRRPIQVRPGRYTVQPRTIVILRRKGVADDGALL